MGYRDDIWWDVHCGQCHCKIAETASSMPMPTLYCSSCAEKERDKNREEVLS